MTRTRPTRCDFCFNASPGQFTRLIGKRIVNMCQRHRDRTRVLEAHQVLQVSVAWRRLAAGQVAT